MINKTNDFFSSQRSTQLLSPVCQISVRQQEPIRPFRFTRAHLSHKVASTSKCEGVPRREPSMRRTDKFSDQGGYLICSRVQCEMTGVENVNLSVRYVLVVAFRLAGIEREIVLAPED